MIHFLNELNIGRKTFFRKILILMICVIETFLLLFSVFIFRNFENVVYKKITDLNYENTAETGRNIANMMSVVENFGNAIYYDSTVQKLMFNNGNLSDFEIQSSLNAISKMISSYSVIDSVIIYNKRINKFYLTNDSYLKDEILQGIEKGQVFPSSIIARRLPKEAYLKNDIVFTYLKSDSFDVRSNVVVINVKLDWLESSFIRKNDIRDLFLVDTSGNIIIDNIMYNSQSVLEKDYFEEIVENDAFHPGDVQVLSEENKVVMFSKIPNTEWYLINESDYDALYNSIETMKGGVILVTVIFMLLGVVIALFLARNLYRPIEGIINSIENTFDDLKKEHFGTDMQYIEGVIKRTKSFSQTMNTYIMKEFLMNSGRVDKQILDKAILHNPRWNGSREIFLMFVQFDEEKNFVSYVKELFIEVEIDVIEFENNRIIIVFEKNDEETVKVKTKELKKASSILYISNECKSHEQILEEYQKIMHRLKYRLIYDGGEVMDQEVISKNLNNVEFTFPNSTYQKILRGLKNRDIQDAKVQLSGFLEAISEVNISNYYLALIKLLLLLCENNDILLSKQSHYLESILSAKSKNDVENIFGEMFSYIVDLSNETEEKAYNFVAEAIKDYIENHYFDKNLSTKSIAGEFKMSQAYIGRLFRTTFGYTITEHINKMRITKSIELLRETNYPISKIMDIIGYENESTFFKIFKAQCGTTPKGYRISIVKKENE